MAGLLYYLPGLSGTLELSQVQEMGLGHAFDETPFCREMIGITPDGGNGLLVIDRKRLKTKIFDENGKEILQDLSAVMNLETQFWEELPSPTDQKIYGGYYKEFKPTPDDLLRNQTIRGCLVPMGDNSEWEIPVVRRFDEQTEEPRSALPSSYRIDPHGELIKDTPLPRWKWLWDVTEEAWNVMINEGDASDQTMLATAGKIFSANYVITHMELGLLRVLSDEAGPAAIVALSLDYHTWSRWAETKKKTEPSQQETAGLNTVPGETDDSITTSPPVPTS